MRLSDFNRLPLMKRIVVVAPSGDLIVTEVRRCTETGLTLKHTTRS